MNRKKKVLIVDDEAFTAMMLQEYIEEKGFLSVGLSSTGEDAIVKARSAGPDLVFMDFQLGGEMNGIEAARIIDAELRVPVVIMSGYDEQIILEKASGYSPQKILRKPMSDGDIDEVLNLIA